MRENSGVGVVFPVFVRSRTGAPILRRISHLPRFGVREAAKTAGGRQRARRPGPWPRSRRRE